MAVVVATGITADGGREILGLDVGDSEDEVFWRGFLTALKTPRPDRGAAGHLRPARRPGGRARTRPSRAPAHQRCRVHFARNLLAHVPKTHTDMVAAVFRTIFAQPDPATVAASLGRGPRPARRPVPQDRHPDGRREDRGARLHRLPPGRTGARSGRTNPLERVNKEIKRRARVVGIFPNERRRHPPRRRRPGRHARRMARRRTPLPLRRAPWPNSTRPAILTPPPRSTAAA